jgi:hypothetical protein
MATQLDELLTEVSSLREQVNAMTSHAITAQNEEQELATPPPVPLPDDAFIGEFLVNTASGKYHLPFVGRSGCATPYKAKCGWQFTDLEHSIASTLSKSDFTMICGVCLPKQRKAARLFVPVAELPAPDLHALDDLARSSSEASDSSV